MDEITGETFAVESAELKGRTGGTGGGGRGPQSWKGENADIAVEAFKLSQNIAPK